MLILGLIDIPVWLLILLGLIIGLYVYGTWTFGAFDGTGILGPKPVPFLGSTGKVFKMGFLDFDEELMRTYGKTVGVFSGRNPGIMTMDEDIIKAVCIKEFHCFTDRLVVHNGDEMASDMINFANGRQWRRLRYLLSPTFSSGKLKSMNPVIHKCAAVLQENLQNYAKSGQSCDIRQLVSAFTMDTIAATAFGLQLDSQKDQSNQFVKMARKIFDASVMNPLFLIALFAPPLMPLMRWLNVTLFPKDVTDFFALVTKQTIEARGKEDSEYRDFLQLMLNAHKSINEDNDVTDPAINQGGEDLSKDVKGLNERELLAQAVLFFIAGFDTTAATISFMCYNLAVNPDKQEKLYQEVKQLMNDKETLDYSSLSQMKYMEQCMNESLRLFPIAFRIERTCVKDVNIKGLLIKEGWRIVFPVYVMAQDPELWENPREFIPERFEDMSDKTYKFMPFGIGPRNCLGKRLAYMEVKTAMAKILTSYKLVKTPDTPVPLTLHKMKMTQPSETIKIGLQARS